MAFSLSLLPALIACGAAVVAVSYARRPASIELQSTVDELIIAFEKMQKTLRKEKMSNVRQGIKSIDGSSPVVSDQLPSTEGLNRKAHLRRLAFGQKGVSH